MVVVGKQRPEEHGPAPASPLLDCALSKDTDLVRVLPWTAAESSEHERTLIWPTTIEKWPAPGTIYPFFLHSIYAGLVPPFSRFFTVVLDHYAIQALHLQPNSIMLLSVFAFYWAQSGNVLLKARKNVDNFRHCWVLICLKDANPLLEEPKGLPEKTSTWISVKLSDPHAVPVLERFSRDISAKRLTGGMIVNEFLAQHLAPLQAYSRPLWEYRAGDDELWLRSQHLPTEDLSGVLAILLGGDPCDLPEALGSLYHRDDRADLVAAMHVFNERGLLPAEGSGPVEVSSGDTFGEGGSKKTVDDRAASVPLASQSVLLCELEDDGATGDISAGTPFRPAATGCHLDGGEEEEDGRQAEGDSRCPTYSHWLVAVYGWGGGGLWGSLPGLGHQSPRAPEASSGDHGDAIALGGLRRPSGSGGVDARNF
ncbi:hypothetical protein D1007_39542 [Hordeum vulgare]|nr:hypothetical protein D1007_39542 [Hordeum vulgare]